jgi:hypothetical protein
MSSPLSCLLKLFKLYLGLCEIFKHLILLFNVLLGLLPNRIPNTLHVALKPSQLLPTIHQSFFKIVIIEKFNNLTFISYINVSLGRCKDLRLDHFPWRNKLFGRVVVGIVEHFEALI